MRKRIDAHMHIYPERLLGTTSGIITYERNGRWIFGGKFAYQAMPEIMENSACTVPTILRVMDNAGVERGVLMQGASDAIIPDTIGAVQMHPDRFWGAMRLNPKASNLAERVQLYYDMGLTVIKCLTQVRAGMPNHYAGNPLDSEIHKAAWKVAEKYGLTVAIDAGFPGNPGYCVDAIRTMAEEFPGLRIVICHMGLPQPGIENRPEEYAAWQRMRSLGKFDNVWFECSALSTFFIEEAYPFPTPQRIVKDFMDEYGPHKVIWASDMPGTLCDGTYRQLIDTYDRSALLTDHEKDLLFYDNAIAAYGKREE
ncbi:MAG: amidohydrolase [Clostridia bacterium]|nr:amidohydrolase [Clostridia bacterium]